MAVNNIFTPMPLMPAATYTGVSAPAVGMQSSTAPAMEVPGPQPVDSYVSAAAKKPQAPQTAAQRQRSVPIRGSRDWFDPDTGEIIEDLRRPQRSPRTPSTKRAAKIAEAKGPKGAREVSALTLTIGERMLRIWSPEAEHDAQLMRGLALLAKYPDVEPFIAVMPDYHLGESSVNGTVIPTVNTLYVNAIGGDIGCGMTCAKLPLSVGDVAGVLREIYEQIYAAVPSGRRSHASPDERIAGLGLFDADLDILNNANRKSAMQQMGTLGGGNHFIEIQADEMGSIHVMIHTGSRVLGQHIRKMGLQMGERLASPRGAVALAADSNAGRSYLEHVEYAVRYAKENRMQILRRVIEAFESHVPNMRGRSADKILKTAIDVPHNYIAVENHFGRKLYVHRKGAIRAGEGEAGVIPGSMGTSSYIVRGRGNPESLESSSHGAGRRMSRGQAMRAIRRHDFIKSMSGIISRQDESVFDEAPAAYKDIETVMRYQRDLVAIVNKLRPLAVIKG